MLFSFFRRHDQRGSSTSSGERLSHAVSARLSKPIVRNHARMLAQGSRKAAYFRDPAVEIRGFLYVGWFRVQGGDCFLLVYWDVVSMALPFTALSGRFFFFNGMSFVGIRFIHSKRFSPTCSLLFVFLS